MFFEKNDDGKGKRSLLSLLLLIAAAALLISVVVIYLSESALVLASAEAENNIIVIDAGHGGEDSGAIGKNGVFEKNLNLEVANILGKYLENAGFTVVYTRKEDKLLYTEAENIKGFRKINDLKNRLRISESYSGGMLVSIHMNSFSQEKYSGLQVYYSENNSDSRILAESIQGSVKSRLQPDNNRSVKNGENMYLMKNSMNPAVLIECGFLTNAAECDKLCEKEYQKELCFAIVCGIMEAKEKIILKGLGKR